MRIRVAWLRPNKIVATASRLMLNYSIRIGVKVISFYQIIIEQFVYFAFILEISIKENKYLFFFKKKKPYKNLAYCFFNFEKF
jgi:hypothetical protein